MERFKKAQQVSTLGIIGNIFLLIIKGIIGIITKSQAMIADSLNSAGDIFSSLMTFIGNKIASIPSDDDHNLGHGKAEYIYSMLISIVMIITSLLIIKEGFLTIITQKTYTYSIWLIIISIITIITKLSLYIYTSKIGKIYKNLLVKANAKDHINDCFLTSCTLISCIFAKYNIFILDGIVGTIIGSWMLITSLKIFKESYDILMDKAISEETKKQVLKIIEEHKEIKKINHFNSTPIGYKYQISFTIFVDGNMKTIDSHRIADNLEKEINKKIDEIYLTVIHVNPIDEQDNTEKLSKSKFRSSFHLKEKEKNYINEKGIEEIKNHAYEFINKRLKPETIKNDGKQTPMKGHPVFIAQHATATCCRGCLEKWHHIKQGKELNDHEIEYIVTLIIEWIKKQKNI